VVDDAGSTIVLERLDGTFPMGSKVSIGKARTAVLFHKPTSFFEDAINKGRFSMTALDDFTPLQGGVPIEIDGQVIGAIGVSGSL
ncbi:heme-binding protein, partial [Acinetobacter baumannii]